MVKEKVLAASEMSQSSLVIGMLTVPLQSGVAEEGTGALSAIWNTPELRGWEAPVIIISFPLGVCSVHVPISRVQFLSGPEKTSQILN